ncbi:MAG: HAMP domain-containing protein, partial [Chloroflexi bacterium]|nr:HAMP domain-containing protein [Chloroflexota bacterium]
MTTADGKHDSAHQSASPSGQVAGLLGGLPGLGFFTRSISGKIIGPYLLVIFAFAIIVTYAVMRLVAGSLEERYLSQLGDAGRSANESVVRIEQDHLKSLRLMTFTEGVAEAARKATKDAPVEQFNQAKGELEKLLKPHQVNARLDYVEAVGPDGELVNALREGDQAARTPANPKVGTWPITQRVLRGETDQQGDKFSELVLDTAADPEKPDGNPGPIFYTVGPIRDGDQVVGAVLVGTPLEKFVQRLARESLTNVSLYGLQGEVLATTLPPDKDGLAGQAIHQDEFRRLTSPEQIVITRGIDSGNRRYQELLGGLEIRGSRQFVVGVAIPQNAIIQAGEATRNQLILLFSVMVAFVLLVGLIVARIITQPILRLVQAHQRIAAGELGPEVFVEVSTNDETGFLTRTFNDMVEGLRDREKVKDAFGRYTNPAL